MGTADYVVPRLGLVIPADVAFLLLAGIAMLGFVFDALFDRLRITSVLPLMLLGVVLVATGAIPSGTTGTLTGLIPYVSALTVAFILFSVGLEIRFTDLFRVLGRATAFTLAVQTATGILLALLAFFFIHWDLYISFIFGFALSGPSSIAVPVLVRVARMPDALRTTLVYESVVSDVLQLLVPLMMLQLLSAGNFSAAAVAGTLVWTVIGSTAAGIAAGVAWLWILDRLREFTSGYSWTLTITMVVATYGFCERIGVSPAISIFVFGLILGNAHLFDLSSRLPKGWFGRFRARFLRLRGVLRLSTGGLDIPHILQVQKEVSFFASAFFFVYIGLLFDAKGVTAPLLELAGAASLAMMAIRLLFSPMLRPYLDRDPVQRRSQRGLVMFDTSRGLAAAVIATIPIGLGLVIPGFLDAMFLGILFSTVVSTYGIFWLYRPSERPPPFPAGTSLSRLSLSDAREALRASAVDRPAAEPPGGSASPPQGPPPP